MTQEIASKIQNCNLSRYCFIACQTTDMNCKGKKHYLHDLGILPYVYNLSIFICSQIIVFDFHYLILLANICWVTNTFQTLWEGQSLFSHYHLEEAQRPFMIICCYPFHDVDWNKWAAGCRGASLTGCRDECWKYYIQLLVQIVLTNKKKSGVCGKEPK